MIVIRGGATEWGAKLAKTLYMQEDQNIVIADRITDNNWHYLKDIILADLIDTNELPAFLETHKKHIKAIINLPHLPVSPTATLQDYLRENFRSPFELYQWCSRHRVRLFHVMCNTVNDSSAYLWSNQLLANAISQLNTVNEREYPAPPQFSLITVGRLFGKELKNSKDDLIRVTLDTNTQQQLTPLDNCWRALLWLLKNPSVSADIDLRDEIPANSVRSLLANQKEAMIVSPGSHSKIDLSHLGFNEPLISIEEGINLLLQQNQSQNS